MAGHSIIWERRTPAGVAAFGRRRRTQPATALARDRVPPPAPRASRSGAGLTLRIGESIVLQRPFEGRPRSARMHAVWTTASATGRTPTKRLVDQPYSTRSDAASVEHPATTAPFSTSDAATRLGSSARASRTRRNARISAGSSPSRGRSSGVARCTRVTRHRFGRSRRHRPSSKAGMPLEQSPRRPHGPMRLHRGLSRRGSWTPRPGTLGVAERASRFDAQPTVWSTPNMLCKGLVTADEPGLP
jgi:hypothetical protein